MKRCRPRLALPKTLTFTAMTIATLSGAIACSSHTHGSGGAGGKAATGGAGGVAATGGAGGGCPSESAFFCVSLSPDAGCPTGEVCQALDCPAGCHPESV